MTGGSWIRGVRFGGLLVLLAVLLFPAHATADEVANARDLKANFSAHTQGVMDNIAGQPQTVRGAVASLKLANSMVASLEVLLDELQQQPPGTKSDAARKQVLTKIEAQKKAIAVGKTWIPKIQKATVDKKGAKIRTVLLGLWPKVGVFAKQAETQAAAWLQSHPPSSGIPGPDDEAQLQAY
jgi:hypothetical protein